MSKIENILKEMTNILIKQKYKKFNFDVSVSQFTYVIKYL